VNERYVRRLRSFFINDIRIAWMDGSEKDLAQARWGICMPYWLFLALAVGSSRGGFGDSAVFL